MAYKVPVGGVFATIYYDFETGFQVYGNDLYGSPGLDDEYYLRINKLLGHAVRITNWRENNNVTLLRGLNNIEAANAIDGRYEGELELEFAAVGTLDWMEALMGLKTDSAEYGSKVYEYTKAGVPKSMTFVIMIQNDANNPHGGDVFVLKGVIMQNVTITVEGTTVPVQVRMTVPYATERAYTSDNLPEFYYPSDNAFNFGQAIAYFWDPVTNAAPGDPASFDTFETACETFNMTINHNAELIFGIGSRKARDRFYKYLDYTVEVKVYYRDKERFLQKFYGCKDGPINDTVPAFKKMKLIIQNCKTCDDTYRRMEFEFDTAKMNTRTSTIDIDEAITETYEFKPLHAVIRAWNGEEPEPQWYVSPLHVKQGDLVAMHAKFLPRSAPANIYIDGELIASLVANCSGELEYRVMANPTYNYWSIGNHNICVEAYTGSDLDPESLVSLCQNVFVTAEDVTSIPKIAVCPQLFSENLVDGRYGTFNIKGYNFGTAGETVTATMAIYCGVGENLMEKGAKKWPPTDYADIEEFISGTLGSFEFTTGTYKSSVSGDPVLDTGTFAADTGILIVEVEQTLVGGGVYTISNNVYIAGLGLMSSDGTVRTITGSGFKPNERSFLYIEELEGGISVMKYKGVGMTDDYGVITFEVDVPDGEWDTEINQQVILSDGSGLLRAFVADIQYPSP
jgi:hypothetical protein